MLNKDHRQAQMINQRDREDLEMARSGHVLPPVDQACRFVGVIIMPPVYVWDCEAPLLEVSAETEHCQVWI